MTATPSLAKPSSEGTTPAPGKTPSESNGMLSAVLYVFMYYDHVLIELACKINGIPCSRASDEADFYAQLAATENSVGFIHLQHLDVAKCLRSNPAFARTPLVILNSDEKRGKQRINEAGLDPFCELEVPFPTNGVLNALNTFR